MDSKQKKFLPKPEYPGGQRAMTAFILQNLKYPETALTEKIEGSVGLRIEINYLGNVSEVKVIRGLTEDCDKEAIRLAKLLIFRVAKIHHLKVSYSKNIFIHFKLPEPKNTILIQYSLTKNETNTAQVAQSNTYIYKIKV